MDDESKGNSEARKERMEEILRERERLDKLIQQKFRKKMAILFSDVCGFTQYVDKVGDISGRAWIQRHHDIVLPAIEGNGGKVLDIMGDGVMAVFVTSISAVKASIDIQRGLEAYNRTAGKEESIHVRIGINAGDILVDGDQIAGDAVNVASRIEGQAHQDQILVSKSVYDEVCGDDELICRAHGEVELKGKRRSVELYRVLWKDEDIVVSHEAKVRAQDIIAEKKPEAAFTVLHIEVTLSASDLLKISANEQRADETSTIKHYDEMNISMERLTALCHETVETLNSVNRKGRLSREVLIKLREVGQVLCDELFTLGVKEKIRETGAEHLMLLLDDQLIHVPWELLHDGRRFLCQRFSMGRLVKTRQAVTGSKSRSLGRPFKMLILADPEGDLKGAYEEGIEIRNLLDRYRDFISVSMHSDNISTDFVRGKIKNFDLVHFAGHADYNPENPVDSGWRLSDGVLRSEHIKRLAGTGSMPALVFSNACQSARSDGWLIYEHFQHEIFGLANAFMVAGVKHYIGTFWEILDEPSSKFALECYKHALSGKTIGEAIRQARLALIKEYGEETIVWASYLLYGDPTFNYMDQAMGAEFEETKQSASKQAVEGGVRAREEVIDFGKEVPGKRRWAWLGAGAALLAMVLLALFVYPGFFQQGVENYEKAALSHYSSGNYEAALDACRGLESRNPDLALAHLIRGHVYLATGRLNEARASYQLAIRAPEATQSQKGEALVGLGRVASIEEEPARALQFYEQASSVNPRGKLGYLSQAALLEEQGDYRSALDMLEKARKLAPEDQALAGFARETRKRLSAIEDQRKRAEIQSLVQELLERMKSPPREVPPSDGWTSPRLTLWIMDFTTEGYSLREGEARVIASGISEELLEHGGIELVERALLDRLLEELKLGTSELADGSTALSLGRILAARLILKGNIVYSGPQTQVSLRLIETETGRISAAVNQSFGSATPVSELIQRLSEGIAEKLETLYPLRGKITQVPLHGRPDPGLCSHSQEISSPGWRSCRPVSDLSMPRPERS